MNPKLSRAPNTGDYILLDESIDLDYWANSYRFDTMEEAMNRARKLAWKERKDYYVAQLVSEIELQPLDVRITEKKLIEGEVNE